MSNLDTIEKSSKESELAILRFISYNQNIKLLYRINKDWIYDLPYQEIYKIWKTQSFVDKFNTIDFFSKSDFYKESIISELYDYEFEVSEEDFIKAIILVEKKYKQRQLHTKLSQSAKKVFSESPEITAMDIVMFMENTISYRKTNSQDIGAPSLKEDLIDLAWGHNKSLSKLNLTTGNIWVIAGRPAHQKTNEALDKGISYLNRCKELGLHSEQFGMFSMEIKKKEFKCRLWASVLDIPFQDVKDGNYNMEEATMRMNTEFKHINDNFLIFDISDCKTNDEMGAIVYSHKFKCWAVDYCQRWAKMQKVSGGTNEKVIDTMSFFKTITMLTNSLLILLAQCRKLDKIDKIKCPREDDIEWAGDITQYANVVTLIFFPLRVNGDHKNFQIKPGQTFEQSDRAIFLRINSKVRNGEMFNQILWSNAHKCQFVSWPDNRKPAPKEYFDW